MSIKESSDDFYQQIANVAAEDLGKLPHTIQNTIWKYFNRACFRATPYASFASVGMASLGPDHLLKISRRQTKHTYPDWMEKDNQEIDFESLVAENSAVLANSSFYQVGSGYRFIAYYEGGYELVDTMLTTLQIEILQFCRSVKTIQQIRDFIAVKNSSDALSDIDHLVSSQLLICAVQPNIIGEDYFKRRMFEPTGDRKYIITERSNIGGSVNSRLFEHVCALTETLKRIIPAHESELLKDFIHKFQAKYEYRQIPLMIALDPELGIGYGGMEQHLINDEIIEKFQSESRNENNKDMVERVRALFIQHTLPGKNAIDLEQMRIPEYSKQGQLPNTFSLLCSTDGHLVQVESLGGCSATSLSGRFTHAGEAFHEHCIQLAAIEQRSNPDVLFFDIAYSTGNVVDNVNRRKQIYPYQLSILNFDTSDDPIAIDDLLISVRDGVLMLRSARLDKRLIPRLASAYNYIKSDLPLFRILCDIQQQSLVAHFPFKLRKLLPGLSKYPRVFFRNLVVSPAAWKLSSKEIGGSYDELFAWLKENKLPQYIRAGFADQTLCFDLLQQQHIAQLRVLLKKQKEIEVEEVIFGGDVAVDEVGRSYAAQFAVAIYHEQEIYKGFRPALFDKGTYVSKKAPGTDWLYFDLYCNPIRANELLSGPIAVFLSLNEQFITMWFFIRYHDGNDHLRLRIQLGDPAEIGQIIASLYRHLSPKINDGSIADIAIRTYEQEVERYGCQQMQFIESLFHLDSKFVLCILKANLDHEQLYQLCVNFLIALNNSAVFEPRELQAIVKRSQESFCVEHRFDTNSFRLMNTALKKLRQAHVEIPQEIQTHQKEFLTSVVRTLDLYLPADRGRIFGSLFHMHVNRLFPAQQRIYEAMVYYFAEKEFLKREKIAVM